MKSSKLTRALPALFAFLTAGQGTYAQSVFGVDSTGNTTVTTLTTTTTAAAPFVVHSTINVANLNASSLNGQTFTSPTITTPAISGAIGFPSGVRQTFAPNATTPGLNVGSNGGDPSIPNDGDLWYNSSSHALRAQINGSTVSLGGGGSAVSITSSTGDLSVSPSPLTGTGTIDLDLAHANTWTGAQTMGQGVLQAVIDTINVANTTAQTCPDGSATILTWDTNNYFTNSLMHNTSSNSSRLVAPTAGVYRFTFTNSWVSDALCTGGNIFIRLNGATRIWTGPLGFAAGAGARDYMGTLSFEYKYNANDYIEIQFAPTGSGTTSAVDAIGTNLVTQNSWTKISN